MTALLEVRDLRTVFGRGREQLCAVDGVSFTVEHRRTLGIVGESGCGKSVTALSVLGLLPSRDARVEGSVRLEGQELTRLSRRALEDVRGREIGLVMQDPMTSLNPTMRIGRQIAEPLRRHLGMSAGAARKRAAELLEEVRVPAGRGHLDCYPHELSGGMRQRVMIAAAIACGPKLLVADEPTTALDVTIQAEVLGLLAALQEGRDMAIVIITHDMGVVARLADEVMVMYAGEVVEQAPAEDLFERPEHPYTQALLGALPQLDDDDVRHRPLAAIPGQPPDLRAPAAGCRFAARCPHAGRGDGCGLHRQPLRPVRPGHVVRTAHPACEREREHGSAEVRGA